ncbi:5085_t:CDS:2 [Acaulospora morrowiae]|uniref:5085_t:CDS:1 n=1 Tax=Acaulospora morrowiae TaxID=94023 RepID=A0A9N8ZFT2_9GLOM|nr:5085_t:CDS:2 [Acaulospora morrowiae]
MSQAFNLTNQTTGITNTFNTFGNNPTTNAAGGFSLQSNQGITSSSNLGGLKPPTSGGFGPGSSFNFGSQVAASRSQGLAPPVGNMGAKTNLSWNVTSSASSQPFFSLGGSSTQTSLTSFSTTTAQGLGTSIGQFNIINVTKATRFTDIPQDYQKYLTNLDNHIQQQKRMMTSIGSMNLPNIKQQIQDVFNESRILFQVPTHSRKKSVGILFIECDNNRCPPSGQSYLGKLLSELDKHIGLVDNARRFYDAASQGQNNAVIQIGDNVFSKYYYDLIVSFEDRLQQYESIIDELERHFYWIYQNPERSNDQDLAALTEAMRNQHNSFMAVTGKVALLHENVEKLRNQYLNYRRTKFLDNINPFVGQDAQKTDAVPVLSIVESMSPRELAQTISRKPPTNQFQSSLFGKR